MPSPRPKVVAYSCKLNHLVQKMGLSGAAMSHLSASRAHALHVHNSAAESSAIRWLPGVNRVETVQPEHLPPLGRPRLH